jgi:PD-(D/E)XK nuclease superfamily protein
MPVNSKTKLGARIRHAKRRGEWAEMCFMIRAAELGLEVNKPWSDTASYDFIVQKGRKMARVQVKSTIAKRNTGYVCKLCDCRGGAYASDSFDFVAVYLILEDTWYIIPEKMVRGKFNISLYPRLKRSKYEPNREAWHELPGTSPKSGTVPSIEACAEEEISFLFLPPGPLGEGSRALLAGI